MRAKKSLGQNFLRDQSVVKQIVGALDLRPDDTVVEIGPGRGALTSLLVERADRVIAIEFDRDLIAPLRVQFHGASNFELVNADALSFDFGDLALTGGPAKLVANLPYNISTPILQHLIKHRQLFERLVLMFQREVVERISAQAGSSQRGFLSVLVEDAFAVERLFDVSPASFQPVPKVWSSIVKLTPKTETTIDIGVFRSLLSTSFSQKRKTLLNNLRSYMPDAAAALNECDIDGSRRAETLTLDEWRRLTERAAR